MNAAKESPVVRVCGLLNAAQATYLIIGGQACILHGLGHTTEDVDILSKETYREQDAADRVRLLDLKRLQESQPTPPPSP